MQDLPPHSKRRETMRIGKPALWMLSCAVVILLSALSFTPFVLPRGTYVPELFGIPRTLWLGILIAFGLVAMTLIGGFVHPANNVDTRHKDSRDRT